MLAAAQVVVPLLPLVDWAETATARRTAGRVNFILLMVGGITSEDAGNGQIL